MLFSGSGAACGLGAFRLLGRWLFEAIVEIAIQGTGHLVLRVPRPHSKPSGTAANLAGPCLWAILITAAFRLWHATPT